MLDGLISRIFRRILDQTKLGIFKATLEIYLIRSRLRRQSIILLLLLPVFGTLIGACLTYGLRDSLGNTVSIKAELLGELLVSLGIALAGVSVIAFSIALFLQQSVSDLYSNQYFVAYSFDRHQKAIFTILLVVVLGQLAFGFYLQALDESEVPLPELVIPLAFGSLAAVFSLLWWQYIHVAKKATPSAVINFLHREADRQFADFHKVATKNARLSNSDPRRDSNQVLAQIYATVLPTAQDFLLPPIHALLEVTMRLANRGDGVASQYGLRVLTAILKDYLNASLNSQQRPEL